LNKEYQDNEGIGEDFGSFLMELDDLSNDILGSKLGKGKKNSKSLREKPESKGKEKKSSKKQDVGSDEEEESFDGEGADEEEEDQDLENESNEEDQEELDDIEGDDDEMDEGEDEDNDEEDEEAESDGDDDDDDSEAAEKKRKAKELEKDLEKFTYKPSSGEDIYGRIIDPEASKAATQKYIPPALRNKQSLATSEKDMMLKRKVKGLINRISEQSKDSIVRELKIQYETSSHNLTNEAIVEYLLEMIQQSSAKLSSIIPLYASIFSSLYFAVGNDIIYHLLEKLFQRLWQYCQDFVLEIRRHGDSQREEYAVRFHRPAYNLLLFFVYFYNYRVLHHSFLIDLMFSLIRPPTASNEGENGAVSGGSSLFRPRVASESKSVLSSEKEAELIEEMQLELLEGIIYHSSEQLRHDDPVAMKQWAMELSQKIKASQAQAVNSEVMLGEGEEESNYSRLQYFYECITDQINLTSKSSKLQKKSKQPIITAIQDTRKWLGSNKRLLGNKMGDIIVRLTISDLMNVETRGRWWRTGASWIGRQQQQQEQKSQPTGATSSLSTSNVAVKAAPSAATTALQKAAKKLHMNTPIRFSIFEQLMTSRDVLDAYERIMKLSISGKNDREIMKVLTECCIAEGEYNAFYKEIMKLFIDYNRQFKLTCQYIIWDLIKLIVGHDDDDNDEGESEGLSTRQILNLGRLMSDLIEMFVIPISAIFKIIDVQMMSENDSLQLLLLTFFLQLFQSKTLDNTAVQTICDRIATTSDYRVVCDNMLFFLEMQVDLKALKQRFTGDVFAQIKERRQLMLRVIKEISVLDYTATGSGPRDQDSDDEGRGPRKKRKFD